MSDLPTALLKKRDYIRDEVIVQYESIGPAGTFALIHIRASVAKADKALKEHDAALMIVALRELEAIK